MYSVVGYPSSTDRVAPFGYSRIKGCLPPPRDFSQAATSFIAFFIPSHPPYALTCFGHPEPRSCSDHETDDSLLLLTFVCRTEIAIIRAKNILSNIFH